MISVRDTGEGNQMPSLKDKTVLIIGRGSGIARAIAMAVSEDGGRVIVAGRHPDDLAAMMTVAHSARCPTRHPRALRSAG